MADQLKPLRKYFKVNERRASLKDWALECRRCNRTWMLKREAKIHPGNVLTLINHAASHDGAR
jgi:hypothetical protein